MKQTSSGKAGAHKAAVAGKPAPMISGIDSGMPALTISGIDSGKASGIDSGKARGIGLGKASGIDSGMPALTISGIDSGKASGKIPGIYSGASSGLHSIKSSETSPSKTMIYIGTDHAGFKLKEKLKQHLSKKGFMVKDFGAFSEEPVDYPKFILPVAKAVSQSQGKAKGIILGGSGQGEAITANRVRGIRAAVYYGGPKKIIALSREHNDANILSLGARFITEKQAIEALGLWLKTPFPGEERHKRRIAEIDALC